MRILTWNMNGIRSVVAKFGGNMKALLEALSADIICFQETKAQLDSELAVVEGWECFFAYSTCASGPGYAGVATYCRTATTPLAVEHGLTGIGTTAGARLESGAPAANPSPTTHLLCDALGLGLEQLEALDREGRALITDHGLFLLVNLYGPAITSEEREEERMAFKMLFYRVLELRLQQWLAAGRAVLMLGDLNISPAAIDSCHPPGAFDHQRCDRVWLNKLLGGHGSGVADDAFRLFHPNRRNAYTCWSTVTSARVNNYGTRIDHILAAGPLPEALTAAAAAAAHSSSGSSDGSHSHALSAANTSSSNSCHPSLPLGEGPPPSHSAPLTPAEAAAAGVEAAAAAAAAATSTPCARFSSLLTGCDIMADFQGSDHAPVWADLAISLQAMPAGHPVPPGAGSRLFPVKQQTIRLWLQPKPKQQYQQQQQQQSQPHPQHPLQQQCGAAGVQPGQRGSSQAGRWQPITAAPSLAAAANTAGPRLVACTSSKQASNCGHPGISTGKRKGDTLTVAGLSSKRSQASLFGLGFKRQAPPQPLQQHAAGAAAAGSADHIAAVAGLQQEACAAGAQEQQQRSPLGQVALQQSIQGAATWPEPSGPQEQQQQQHSQQEAGSSAGEGYEAEAAAAVGQALQQHQQEAAAEWQRISQKMKPPNCYHKELCVVRVSKKQNENYLRQFYCCARPAGPPGVGRCNFFQWATAPKVKTKGAGQARRGVR